MCQSAYVQLQDPNAKITAVKAAQKFFSEDKDRAFEAKVSATLFVVLGT